MVTASVKDLARHLGKKGHIWLHGMEVAIEVVDARISFGYVQLEVAPTSGRGTAWVAMDSVHLIEEA